MDAVIVPEPPKPERDALLEALQAAERDPYGSAWRREALSEGTDTDEPEP